MNVDKLIDKYYVEIVMNKPSCIEIKNSYERYCVYKALNKYALNWNDLWFNKSYKKKIKYASEDTCKYCFKHKNNSKNITEWETNQYENYCGGNVYYKCNTCNNNHAKIWKKNDKMFTEKQPYKINIFYTPQKNMRFFKNN